MPAPNCLPAGLKPGHRSIFLTMTGLAAALPLLAALLLATPLCSRAEELHSGMLRYPDVSATQVVFVYDNDIWIAPKEGGAALPLSSPPGQERFPRFSPDGSHVAYSAAYDGNDDVYEIAVSGGVPRRLTIQPYGARVVDYSPNGRVCFATGDIATDETTLWYADPAGGLPERLSLRFGDMASFSADGQWVAFTPWRHIWQDDSWDRYQGGQAADIWTFNLSTKESRRLTDYPGTDDLPMVCGQRIFFLSDAGPEQRRNIWVYDLSTKQRSQVTHFDAAEVRWPAAGPQDIVFQNGGRLWRMPLDTLQPIELHVELAGDRPNARPVTLQQDGHPDRSCLSPAGKRLAIEKRGDIWSIPAKEGYPVCLTPTDGVAEREPAWSPDGKWIAYISDESRSSYELYVRPADGSGEARRLTEGSKCRLQYPHWSPDSKWIAYSNVQGELYFVSADKGGQQLFASDPFSFPQGPLHWSPDSRWLAYEQTDEKTRNVTIRVHNIESGEDQALTSPAFTSLSPCFDLSGDWLYYSSNQSFEPIYSDVDDYDTFLFANSTRLAALPLRRDVKSPFLPRNDEQPAGDAEKPGAETEAAGEHKPGARPEGAGESKVAAKKGEAAEEDEDKDEDAVKPVKIEFEDIIGRAIGLPVSPGVFHTLEGGQQKLYYVSMPRTGAEPGPGELKVFDLAAAAKAEGGEGGPPPGLEDAEEEDEDYTLRADIRSLATAGRDKRARAQRFQPPGEESEEDYVLLPGVDGFQITPDGAQLLVYAGGEIFVTAAERGAALDKPVPLPTLRKELDPYHEWEQMVWEDWRSFKEEFWDPNLHGVDWNAARDRALAMLPYVACAEDMGFVISEMNAELNVGHSYVSAPSSDAAPWPNLGMLGCDFERASDSDGHPGIRISRIYRGAASELDTSGPLDEAGVNIPVGKFLQAVNGVPLDPARSPFYYLLGQAGQTVKLSVGDKAARDASSRDLLVKTLGFDGDLRHSDWVEHNRQYCYEKSGGRVGYIHISDTADQGISDLMRQFVGQHNMDALVLDERYNHGGNVAHRFIELLNRHVVEYDMAHNGKSIPFPQMTAQGAKVMLVNQYAGSGGDGLPWLFRQAGLGQIVGVRTWGGWVGIGGHEPLLDGTYYFVPSWYSYEPNGTWMIEGYGVDPDVVVVNDPSSTSAGLDPQLDAAIATALAEADAHPYVVPPAPPYPNRSRAGVRPEDR